MFLVLCTICEKKCTGVFLICDVLFVTAAIFIGVIDVFLGIEMADAGTHRIKIQISVDCVNRHLVRMVNC